MSDENASDGKVKQSSGFLTLANARDLSVVVLILVVGSRFATADFNIDLKDFSFTDLVSLFLAVSSVALSALFYFKADESSRTFTLILINSQKKFQRCSVESILALGRNLQTLVEVTRI